MLSVLLLSSIALICQYPSTEAFNYFEAKYQKAVPSSPPKFDDNVNAANDPLVRGQASSSSRSIGVDQLTLYDQVACSFNAPQTGRVYLDFIDDERDHIALQVDVRYNGNVLVLNSFKDGSWGNEIRPSGFDFSPHWVNIMVIVGVDGFHIYTVPNSGDDLNYIAKFPFRLPLESINRVRMTSEGNYATSHVSWTITYME